MGVEFSEQDARRIAAVVREAERDERNPPAPRGRSAPVAPDVQPVRITSTTLDAGRYPGKILAHDASAGTWTDLDDCWVISHNGDPLDTQRYMARRSGAAGSPEQPVFMVEGAAARRIVVNGFNWPVFDGETTAYIESVSGGGVSLAAPSGTGATPTDPTGGAILAIVIKGTGEAGNGGLLGGGYIQFSRAGGSGTAGETEFPRIILTSSTGSVYGKTGTFAGLSFTSGILTSGSFTGGLPDGTYGDIIVSGGGTVMDIAAGAVGSAELASSAVTPAKLHDDVRGEIMLLTEIF